MTNIVIIGAGFAGIAAALGLEKKFKNNKEITIILVDRHDYHLFSPNLCEAATSEEELSTVLQIKKSLALPIKEILQNKRINFIQGECAGVDPKNKTLSVGIKKINYDFLVLATGSSPDFSKTSGVEENSLPLGSLSDALRIRNRVEFSIQAHSKDINKKLLRFVVAGGGSDGVELAGELKKLLNFLSWKYSYPNQLLEILIAESGNELVSGINRNLSSDVYSRLKDLGINTLLNQRIIRADHHFVEFLSGEKIHYELLFWTGGMKAVSLSLGDSMVKNNKGNIETDEYFRIKGDDYIFVIGDLACIGNTSLPANLKNPQAAIHQGRYLANALPLYLQNQKPSRYTSKSFNFVVKISGKWAIVYNKYFYITGYLGYLVNLISHFGYYCSLVGVKKAFRYVIREMDLFSRND